MSKFQNKVGIRVGTVIDKDTGKSFDDLNDALRKEAECGFGLDNCANELRLRDKTTGESIALYFNNQVPYMRLADGTVLQITAVEV